MAVTSTASARIPSLASTDAPRAARGTTICLSTVRLLPILQTHVARNPDVTSRQASAQQCSCQPELHDHQPRPHPDRLSRQRIHHHSNTACIRE
ncbi:hypothetical protein DPMN_173134 [Dreissena polymorpha]|uniref:Uncharacterized protein n=1 Tax=Dreissena polymorpha TaxID=45954 RepID=A0A9D4E3I4_DREPO|nr:hypothetical protein DPMN_173134 [Dreissena polymorpha]